MSRNPYRAAFGKRGWVDIRWHHEYNPPSGIVDLALRAARLPGVRYEEGWSSVTVPRTAWATPEFSSLLGATKTHEVFLDKVPASPLRPQTDLLGDLYPWQEQAVERALGNGQGLLLADTMGLGKTRSAIAAVEAACVSLDPGKTRARIVIGPGFTRAVWLRELLAVGAIEDESQFCALYTRNDKDVSFNEDALWYFIHYDIVHSWGTKLAMRRRPIACVLDEIHWLKNPKARRTRGSQQVSSGARFRMFLTGTPMANRVGELYQPLSLLTGVRSWGSWGDFRVRYAGALRTQFGLSDRDPQNVQELRARMAPYYLRRTVDDIEEGLLPPLRRSKLTVDLDARTLEAHHEAGSAADLAEMVEAVVDGRAGQAVLGILVRLRMLTGEAKINATVEYVRNMLAQEASVVIFTWMRRTAEAIAKRLRPTPQNHRRNILLATLHGKHPQVERDAHVEAFQAHEGPACIVATYGALREGVTLTKGTQVVLHDLDWMPSTILQAEARIWRLGQTQPCTSTWVLAADSIDTLLARALLMKADHIERTLGIDAPAQAMDELELREVAGYAELKDWAADTLERWMG